MKQKLLFIASVVLCVGLAFTACKKKNYNGSFTVKGRVLLNCSDSPAVNQLLQLYYGNNNTTSLTGLGAVYTDINGNFSISCHDHGSGYLKITPFINAYQISGGDGSVTDLGTVYLNNTYNANLRIMVQGSHSNKDTLYTSIDRLKIDTLVPLKGQSFQHFSLMRAGNLYPDVKTSDSIILWWGIGKRDYDSSINSAGFKPYHWLKMPTTLCGVGDTTVLNVP